MHDSGGGGGSSGTNWYNISVETMWQWVDRDLSPHYDQSTSWKKTSELSGLYHLRLQAFRDKLAQSWNPQTSKAAETFLTKIDDLIKAVKDVDEVAGRNYQAAVDIPNAIFEAKLKLKPIYDRWKQSETPDDADDNQIQAAGVMYTLSSDLSTARTTLGPPKPYLAPVPQRDSGGDYDTGAPTPPMIPPVVPSPPPSVPGPVSTGPMTPTPMPKGPDLSGLTPPTPGPFPPTSPPGPGPGPHIPPPGNPGPLPPGGPVIKPPPRVPGPTVPGIPGPGRPGLPGRPGPIPSGLPPTGRGPSGVIGAAPPPPGGGRPVGGMRANPVGGMIGGAATGRGPAGAGMAGRSGAPGTGRGPAGGLGATGRGAMGAMGVGGRPGQREDGDGEHLDPDTEWDVAEGVAPVLDTPEKQGPIDPGPAIGLSR